MTNPHTHPLAGVRTRRLLLNIPVDAAAKALGIERTSYYRLERGERVIQLPKAITLAHMLGCTVEELGQEPSIDDKIAHLRAQEAPADNSNSVVAAQVPVVARISDEPLDPYLGRLEGVRVVDRETGDVTGLPDDVAETLREAEEGE